MTIAAGSPGGAARGLGRRLGLVVLLLSVFLASLGTFIYLVRQGRIPEAGPGLPEALGITGRKLPRFDHTLTPVGQPLAVAVSPDGSRIFVAEGRDDRAIRVIGAGGDPIGAFTPPHTTAGTRRPVGLAVAPDGTLYATDRLVNQVLVFDADGALRETLRPSGVDRWAPVGLTIDASGLIYVAEALDLPEAQRHRIWVLQPDGTVVRSFGEKGDGAGDLMFPHSLAVDGLGRIWVGDITGVKAFSPEGAYLFGLPAEGDIGVGLPGGLAYAGGLLYVTDVTNHRVLVYQVAADDVTFGFEFGRLGFGKGELRYPEGIAVWSNRIYIANRENSRIDIWTR